MWSIFTLSIDENKKKHLVNKGLLQSDGCTKNKKSNIFGNLKKDSVGVSVFQNIWGLAGGCVRQTLIHLAPK